MSRSHRTALLLAAGLVAAWSWRPPAAAQDRSTDMPFPLLLPRETAVARMRAVRDRMPYVPGEALVRFRDGVDTPQQLRALSVLRGGGAPAGVRWIGNVLLVHAQSEPNAEAMADVLGRQPEIAWAEPNYMAHLDMVPNDTSYGRQWNLGLINMPAAWDINPGASPSVIVAVVDTGEATTTASYSFRLWNGTTFASTVIPFAVNPDISSSRIASGRDFAFWTGPVLDMVGHGTHVAGTILQDTNNNLGFAGIAYSTRLMPVKACFGYWEVQIVQASLDIPGYADADAGGCATSDIVAGIRYAADNGANVINLSLGGPDQSSAEREAVQYAVQKGVFVTMAAGNEFEDGNPVEYPAAYGAEIDGAMAVGAVGRGRNRAFYSNTGSHVEIVAPGGDFRADGLAGVIYQVGLFDNDSDPALVSAPRFDRYYEKPAQGTSMAAPHVAGVAALLHSQGITNPAAIEAAIKKTAVDLGTPGRDDQYGYGLIDARAALRGMGAAR
jgi:serine protease